MHPKDDLLRALLDQQEIDPAAREHIAGCADCQARLDELAARANRVQARLDVLSPRSSEQHQPAQAAYSRLVSSKRFNQFAQQINRQKEFNKIMSNRRPLWSALAIIAVLALVFTLTPANAWASSFLGLFRVQKVQVITFDPAAAENARARLQSNQAAIEQLFKDDLKVTEHGQAAKVASAEEAAAKAGFTPRLSVTVQDQSLEVKGATKAVFTINQPKLQELIDTAGVNVQLPKEVDGKAITADIPSSVIATSGCPAGQTTSDPAAGGPMKESGANCTVFVQMPSPTVDTPAGLDMQSLGAAMFEFMGVSPDQAQQLSRRIDWTSTLVLPIPQGGKVQYQDVQVDGVTGTFLQEQGQNSYALVWVKDGVLYGLRGPGGLSDAMKYVDALK